MIIDTHLHVYAEAEQGLFETGAYPITEYGPLDSVRFSERAGTVEDALAALDEAGASYAAMLGSFELPDLPHPPSGRHWPGEPALPEFADDLVAYNRWLCAVGAGDPRLLPFVTVNPAVLGGRAAARHVDDLLRSHGARGMKLHPIAIRTHPDDPGLAPVFDVMQEAGAPVVVHCGPDARGFGWSLPSAFEPVLDRHPSLPLVLAHLGGARWRDVVALAEHRPGLRFDLSEIVNWIGAPEAPSGERLVALVRAIGVERVLAGSDFPWYEPAHTVEIVESLPFGAAERALILGDNAAVLLGLD